MSKCPREDQLPAFLADTLSAADRDAVAVHLEGCPDCQRVLDELTNARLPEWRGLLATSKRLPAADALLETMPMEFRSQATPPPLAAGYDVLGELGRGGMGVVYKARQRSLNRFVALKVMLWAGAAEEDRARFRREAEALALLPHPHIVQIHEVGETAGQLFLALEYLGGGTLDDRLRGNPQLPRAAAELVEVLARTIHFAHERGIVHRDLKPANILFDESGEPKVADFGLARLLAASGASRTGDILGTPSYMAPEQATGQVAALGPGADVWALGAILYECLTGRAPFRAAQPLLTLQQVVHHEPAAPSRLVPGVPRDLETICLKCLEKDTARRYGSAAALADDCAAFLRGEPIAARPAGVVERAIKWSRRRPVVAGLLAALVLVTTVGFGLVTWQWGVAVRATESEAEQRRIAERQLLETRTALYVADLDRAQQSWREGDEARARELLARCPAELRGWEWRYLNRLYQTGRVAFKGHTGWVTGLAVSPDGQRVASASKDGSIRLWDVNSGREVLAVARPPESNLLLAYHPDGKSLAASRNDGGVEVRDATTLEVMRTWQAGHSIHGLALAADGRLATCGEGNEVRVWDSATGTALATLRGNFGRGFGVAFGPDGKQLAAVGGDGTIQGWDVATGAVAFVRRLPRGSFFGVAYSPDGRYLAAAGYAGQGEIYVWDDAGKPVRSFLDLTGIVWDIAFDPTGSLLAAADDKGTVKAWDTRAWREQRSLPNAHVGRIHRLCFAPAGDRLFTCGNDATVQLWPMVDRRRVSFATRARAPLDRVLATLAFSPDGKRLAEAIGPDVDGQDRPVSLWETARGDRLTTLNGHTRDINALAFSTDGALLAAADEGGEVKVWHPETGRAVLSFRPHEDAPCRALAVRPGTAQFATAGVDDSIRLWELSGEPPALAHRAAGELRSGIGKLQSIAFDSRGEWLAACGACGAVQVWDVAGGTVRTTIAAPGEPAPGDPFPATAALAPRGELVAVTGGGRAALYSTRTGRQVVPLQGEALAPAFSPDGRRLVAASRSDRRAVQVLDTVTGQLLLTFRVGKAVVVAVAFSPDGQRVAAADADGFITIWEAGPASDNAD